MFLGGPFGTVISMPLSAIISTSSIGWPAIFYIYGGFGLIWTVVWIFLGCDDPMKHKNLQPSEQKFLESTIDTNKENVIN